MPLSLAEIIFFPTDGKQVNAFDQSSHAVERAKHHLSHHQQSFDLPQWDSHVFGRTVFFRLQTSIDGIHVPREMWLRLEAEAHGCCSTPMLAGHTGCTCPSRFGSIGNMSANEAAGINMAQ
jgi:hypothetical protein